MDKKNLIIGIMALLVLVIIISGYDKQTIPPTDVGIDTPPENTASVQVNVIDKTTGDSIENAVIYLGTGASEKCYSNSEGKCSIEDFVWGDYALGAFKKGYNRYQESRHFEKGDNSVTIELEKKSEIPISRNCYKNHNS